MSFKIKNKISFPKKLILLVLSLILVITLILVSYKGARAAVGVPKIIYYQGKLTNTNGSIVADGNYNFTISIYDDPSAGSRLWTWKGTTGSPQTVSVAVANGLVSIPLGDTTTYAGTNTLSLDFNADTYYLGITVGGDSEMTRVRIGASGYGINVDTVGGNHFGNTAAQGDILYGSSTGIFSTLAKDTNATRYLSNTGTNNNPAWAQVNLTNGVTGILPIANSGTNASDAATARSNLQIAQLGNNTDIGCIDSLNQQESLRLSPYGVSAGNTAEIRFKELAANGTDYVGFKAPDSIASPKIWTLPSADGSAGQLLSTDGSGTLSWTSSGNIKQLVQSYTVDSGQSITAGDVVSVINNSGAKLRKGFDYSTFGSESEFKGATSTWVAAVTLSSNKFAVAFRDEGDSNKGKAVIGTVSGTTITYGSLYTFSTNAVSYISIASLSSTRIAVCYRDEGDSNRGKGIIGNITSDTVITFGTAVVFNAAGSYATDYISAAGLSSNKFVVAYEDATGWGGSNEGETVIGAVTDPDTLSFSGTAPIAFSTGLSVYISVASLTADKFVIAWKDTGGSGYGKATVYTVSGTTISAASTATTFNSVTTDYIGVASLSTDKFVIAWKDTGGSGYGKAIISSLPAYSTSGTSLTFGTAATFNGATTTPYYQPVTALSSEKFLVAYRDDGNSNYGTTSIGTVSGTTIAFATKSTFNSAATDYTAPVALTTEKYVVNYEDTGNSNHGTGIVGQTVPAIGISKETKAAGNSCIVYIRGISDVHSSLTVGSTYYATPDGALTTTYYPDRAGLATATTDILLDGRWSTNDDVYADLLFSNNFRIIESADQNEGLSFLNQSSSEIMSLKEEGNLSVPGFLQGQGLNIGQNSLVVTANDEIGIGTDAPTSKIDVAGNFGWDQLRLQKPYTPKGKDDPAGAVGSICWDENYLYVKTNEGWKRTNKMKNLY